MISIVIPTLNEERLLPDCLESLKIQDYSGQVELIIADNGSTDRTVSIARSYGAKVLFCSEQRGVFYARKVGADAARGDIIVQADADTVYPQGWLSRIAEQLALNPAAVAMTGRFFYRDPTRVARPEIWARNLINLVTARLLDKPLLVSGATFAFRRKAFAAVNGYEGLTYSADQYGIATRLSKVGKVLYDPDLYILTSARSVRKPGPRLFLAVLSNISRLARYVISCRLEEARLAIHKTRGRRVAAGVAPVAMIIMLIAAYGYFIPASPVFGKVYAKGKPFEKVAALTFDDGPNEPYTSQVLDVLKRYDVKATFFVIGKNVELYPDTAKRILAEGNVLGNHSYSHDANHALTTEGVKDLRQAQMAIFLVTGVMPSLYRPPHGRKSPYELYMARKMGLNEVTWTVSTRELGGKPASEIAKQLVIKTDPGEIMLLHDGYGTAHNTAKANKSVTVQALPQVIEQMRARGYALVTVPELLSVPAYQN